jgi:hypothetical protein
VTATVLVVLGAVVGAIKAGAVTVLEAGAAAGTVTVVAFWALATTAEAHNIPRTAMAIFFIVYVSV